MELDLDLDLNGEAFSDITLRLDRIDCVPFVSIELDFELERIFIEISPVCNLSNSVLRNHSISSYA